MATKEDQRYLTSTWWDVKVYCLEVGKAHNGYVVVSAHFDLPDRVRKTALWGVYYWPKGWAVAKGYTAAVTEYMPHTDYKAVTDLVMRMCYDLDAMLTRREREALAQSSF